MPSPGGGSSLMMDELFEAGDDRFLEEVLKSRSDKKLKSLAGKWLQDPRPFARRMLLAYVDDGCDRPNHRPLVKAIFKHAEKAADDELMGHFLCAFDRIVRRKLIKRIHHYDHQSGATIYSYKLKEMPNIPRSSPKDPKAAQWVSNADRFSLKTRHHLQRRTWRYFRKIGYRDAARYGRAIRAALQLYDDASLATGEALIDSWGLVQALYWDSDVLFPHPMGVIVADGRTLAELKPAPIFVPAWQGHVAEVLNLITGARARTVRAAAIDILRQHDAPALRKLPSAAVWRLLSSVHDEVQAFGVEALREMEGIESLPLDEWLQLLSLRSVVVAPLVAELVQKHVSPDRLSLEQLVTLANAPVAPIAELGLRWTRARPVRGADLPALIKLARAPVATVRAEAAAWLLQLFTLNEREATPEHLRELLDSRYADVRALSLQRMEQDPRFTDSAPLWRALAESPYDDARAFLVKHLDRRLSALEPASLQHVWATTLLAVHRGSRAKGAAARQVADRIVKKPAEADALLPLLGHALRSVRATERVAAVAALSRAAFEAPQLQEAIARRLPELKLLGTEVTR